MNVDDEQLQLEMRALAELLLDIYEYRVQMADKLKRHDRRRQLDADCPDLNMEERSQ